MTDHDTTIRDNRVAVHRPPRGPLMIRAWLCRHHHHTWGRPRTYGWSTLTYRHCRHCGTSDNGRTM